MLSHISGAGKCEGKCPKCDKENLYFSHLLDGSGFYSTTSCLEKECDYVEKIVNGKVIMLT